MFKIGDKIEILNNAFDGSDEPADFEWRGLKGEVIADFGDGAYEVYVAGKGTCCLIESEMGEAAQHSVQRTRAYCECKKPVEFLYGDIYYCKVCNRPAANANR